MVKKKIKLTKFELDIMNALWEREQLSIREIHNSYPEKKRPAYTTVQTVVYRLEAKGAVRRTKKIGNAHIFEAIITPDEARRRAVDDLLGFFGGSVRPLMAHLAETKKLSVEDLRYAETVLSDIERGNKNQNHRSQKGQ